ncbi:hypothetical protein C9374_003448 [Naegleria lovaniensis]|uniref:Sulfite exporter TauE/SafE n=1 Tax=Naegleria lovaniensis TaxID=51637 RepID=A0AA88GTA4_NAELO|nr:uncharacterized protein C9374_003448 [Naegleria lovaniensis]KAG2385633.1 hypothetical protein C9374_003448 [Naegleria lovaniensis]
MAPHNLLEAFSSKLSSPHFTDPITMRRRDGVISQRFFGTLLLISCVVLMMMSLVAHQVEALGPAPPLEQKLIDVLGKNCTEETLERDCGGLMKLVCAMGKCSLCNETTQCSAQVDTVYSCKFTGFYMNQTNGSTGGICQHKDLLDYFSLFDLFSVLSNFVGSVLSSAGGTGGGGVFVPLLHVVGRFNAQQAVPLSKVMIFGAAITNVATLLVRRHPYANKPLIDFDVALMMEPSTLLGTIIGVFLNITCPEWVIVMSVIIVLTITTVLSFYKFFQKARVDFAFLFKRKKKEEYQPLTAEQPTQDAYGSVNKDVNEESTIEPSSVTDATPSKDLTTPSSETNDAEEKLIPSWGWQVIKRTPLVKILVLVLCWVIIFTLSLLRGGEGAPSIIGIEMCSVTYWVLVGLSFPIVGVIMIIIAVYLLIDYRKKVKNGFKFVQGDVKWNWINVTLYPGACLLAGILASSDPAVGAATAAFMIFFTSSISSAQFIIVGRIPLDYGLLYGLTGFLSGFVGFFFVTFVVERWGKRSLIILCVAIVLLSATLLMGGVGIYDVVVDMKTGVYMGFHNLCA